MATPEELLSQAGAAGATIRRKPAWQQLRDLGMGGQGSAAANKAALASRVGELSSLKSSAEGASPSVSILDPSGASAVKPSSVGATEPGSTVGEPPPTPIRTPDAGGVRSGPGLALGGGDQAATEAIMRRAAETRAAAGPNFQEDPGFSGPRANPLRALRVGGPVTQPAVDKMPNPPARVMALRALRGRVPLGYNPGLDNFGPLTSGPAPIEPPTAVDLSRAADVPTPSPGAGMTKPRFPLPSGGALPGGGRLISGAPPEPVQGAPAGDETPPWAGLAALMKPRRQALGDLGGGGGLAPENRMAAY